MQLLGALPVAAAAESVPDDNPRVASRFWLAACLLPSIMGVLLAAGALLAPSVATITPHLERTRPHLCWRNLMQAPDAVWHFRLAGTAALGIILFAVGRFIWRWTSSRRVERLAQATDGRGGNARMLTARSDDMFSFTVGLRQGLVVLSQGLKDTLTDEQLQALVAHEQAHIDRKDNMWHLLIELAATLALPMPVGFLYAYWWRASAEADCDCRAAETTTSATVSQLLVTLQEHVAHTKPALPAGLTPVYYGSISPIHRARRLTAAPHPLVAPPLGFVLVGELLVLLTAAFIARRWLWDSLYCAGESVLRVMGGG